MKQRIVKIQVFGVFRSFWSSQAAELEIQVSSPTTVAEIKAALERKLENKWGDTSSKKDLDLKSLLSRSVLADDHRVLRNSDEIAESQSPVVLSLLPPVCGG